MDDHRMYELIARKLSGEATDAELQELHHHLKQHAGDQYWNELMTNWWMQPPNPGHEESPDEEERFQRILQAADTTPVIELPSFAIPSPVKKIYQRRWFFYAAILVALAGITSLAWPFLFRSSSAGKAGTAALNEVRAKPGSKSKLVLPDGTQVWLNAESKLTYLNDFNQSLREVNLEGEAFFDVTHDKSRPFIVHTSGIDIKVLGTAFNIRSYAADATIEATLLRGSIEVVRHNDENAPRIILRPNEKLVFNKVQPVAETKNTDMVTAQREDLQEAGISVTAIPGNRPDSIMKETAWIYNKLIFDGDSFGELAEKMERWYNVTITIRDERLRQLRLKGSFENETIREALEALQLTAPFEFNSTGNEITINRK